MKHTNKLTRQRRRSVGLLSALAIAGTIGAMSTLAVGDEVIMRDGTVYTGTVVNRSRKTVEIDTTVHGISTRLKLDRRRIKSIVIDDANSKDTADIPATTTVNPTTIIPKVTEQQEDENQVLKRDGYNLILEVPLKGTFGKDIYPLGIKNSLEWAKQNGVTDVVFRIDSGGGAVWAAMDMVSIMNEYRADIKMHMLIESSISASIWPSFTCHTITMCPGSEFGGAVAYTTNATGSTEVDLKLNGIWAATLESDADANGHEGLLVKAMMLSASSIYAYKEDGVWKFSGTSEGLPKGYETIDGPDSVLTLTAKQAIKYGLVDAMKDGNTLDEFATIQGIEKWDNAGNIGHEIIERDVEKSKRVNERLTSTINNFYREMGLLGNRNYRSTYGSSLQTMRKLLGTYKRLIKDAQKMHMPSILDGYEEAIDVPFWEEEIKTRMAELRRMSRQGP